jgi:hypothetical protein
MQCTFCRSFDRCDVPCAQVNMRSEEIWVKNLCKFSYKKIVKTSLPPSINKQQQQAEIRAGPPSSLVTSPQGYQWVVGWPLPAHSSCTGPPSLAYFDLLMPILQHPPMFLLILLAHKKSEKTFLNNHFIHLKLWIGFHMSIFCVKSFLVKEEGEKRHILG